MAKATKQTKTVEVVKTEEREVILLELSMREAAVLTSILGKTKGEISPARYITSELYHALLDVTQVSVFQQRDLAGDNYTVSTPAWLLDLPE